MLLLGHAQRSRANADNASPASYTKCYTDRLKDVVRHPNSQKARLYLGSTSKQKKKGGNQSPLEGISQACSTLVSSTCKNVRLASDCIDAFEGQLTKERDACFDNSNSGTKKSDCEIEITRLEIYLKEKHKMGALSCFSNLKNCSDDIRSFGGRSQKDIVTETNSTGATESNIPYQAPLSITALTKTTKSKLQSLTRAPASAKNTQTSATNQKIVRIKKNILLKRKPTFFGANYLLRFFPKDSLSETGEGGGNSKDHILTESLKKLGIKKLRYPGGNFSQNIDPLSNKVFVPEIEPYEKRVFAKNPANYPSPEDFCNRLEAIGAKGVVVINIESGFVVNQKGEPYISGGILPNGKKQVAYNTTDFDKGLKRSVKSLKALANRMKDLKCPIGQWEIGNESNHANFIYPYSASEYAKSAIAHTSALRKILPGARVGINNGKLDMVAFRDRLNAKGNKELFKKSIAERIAFFDQAKYEGAGIKKAAKDLNGGVEVAEPKKWWKTVIEGINRKSSFDYVVVHSYVKERNKIEFSNELNNKAKVFSNLAGKKIMLSLSELGVYPKIKFGNDGKGAYSYTDFGLDYATLLSEMLHSPVQDFEAYDLKFAERSLIDIDTQKVTPAGEAFSMLSMGVGTNVLEDHHDISNLHVVSSIESKRLSTILINRSGKKQKYILSFEHDIKSIKKAKILISNTGGDDFKVVSEEKHITQIPNSNDFSVTLPARSISRYYFSIK